MSFRVATFMILLIAAAAAASAIFRVVTAPDRIRQRHLTAQETCLKNGGQWVEEARGAICKRD